MSAEEKRIRQERARRFSTIKWSVFWALSLFLIVGLLYVGADSDDPNNKLVSREGVHNHAKLSVFINGKEELIPSGVGLLPGQEHPHQMHTHEADQIIHVEIPGRVHENDMKLKNFFQVWGKEFSRENILGNIATGTKKIVMKVGGVENQDFENYIIRDKDEIVISYE